MWTTNDRAIRKTEPVGTWDLEPMESLDSPQWVLRATELGTANRSRAASHAGVSLQPTLTLAHSG
jgi:hypothetical protein